MDKVFPQSFTLGTTLWPADMALSGLLPSSCQLSLRVQPHKRHLFIHLNSLLWLKMLKPVPMRDVIDYTVLNRNVRVDLSHNAKICNFMSCMFIIKQYTSTTGNMFGALMTGYWVFFMNVSLFPVSSVVQCWTVLLFSQTNKASFSLSGLSTIIAP